ncbi:MAG TPA: hypothetical protein VF590_00980 [Isosphaeraceae bacterium]|jgi:hypothetical protein
MMMRGRVSARLALAAAALLAAPVARSEAQVAGGFGPDGLVFPRFSPQGEWAEVLTVTPRWLVLQNQQGQQFPVNIDSVQLFFMRWPTSPDRLTPDALIEAYGAIRFSNQIVTDHVDVFQGPSRAMTTPRQDPYDQFDQLVIPSSIIGREYTFGDDFRNSGNTGQPVQLHVAGPVVNRNPLTVMTPGNSPVSILGPQGLPLMFLKTQGAMPLVQPGDLAWFVTIGSGPRSLSLAQLWVYKSVPFSP